MKAVEIDLAKEYGLEGYAKLHAVALSCPWDTAMPWKRPALIVVPGGGYAMVSNREGEPVASVFLAKGYQAFVLNYTVGGEYGLPYPQQLSEIAAAVDYVKKHADEFSVNPDEIFVVGFSAGGHLVGDLCIEYASVPQITGKPLDCKPTAVGLCYPVISQKHGHQGSYQNLLYGYSDEAKAELLQTLNLDESVTESTPPAFIWATATDSCVPCDNALRYATALDKHGVSFELHIYPEGEHGMSTGTKEFNLDTPALSRVYRWVDECDRFFKRYVAERI